MLIILIQEAERILITWEREDNLGLLHLKKSIESYTKYGRVVLGRNLDNSSKLINEKLDMKANRSKLLE